jgi:hypothetical protein
VGQLNWDQVKVTCIDVCGHVVDASTGKSKHQLTRHQEVNIEKNLFEPACPASQCPRHDILTLDKPATILKGHVMNTYDSNGSHIRVTPYFEIL